MARSASRPTHSRVNWSTTVRMRNERPSANLSLIRSILQLWFGPTAIDLITRCRRAIFRRCLVRTINFLRVQPVNAFRIHLPTFSSQPHRQTPGGIAHGRRRHLAQTPPQHFIEPPNFLPIQPARPSQPHQSGYSTLPDLIRLLGPLPQLPPQPGLYSFFDTISCRICLSRLRSATSRFNRPFSSRSCRSSRSSLTPNPAYCFFHA